MRGVIAYVLDCDIEVNEFKLQSCYYVPFQTNTLEKSINPSILSSYGLNSINCCSSTRIKYPTKVGIPLNKETKPNHTKKGSYFQTVTQTEISIYKQQLETCQ